MLTEGNLFFQCLKSKLYKLESFELENFYSFSQTKKDARYWSQSQLTFTIEKIDFETIKHLKSEICKVYPYFSIHLKILREFNYGRPSLLVFEVKSRHHLL